jgi:hypothetical protein
MDADVVPASCRCLCHQGAAAHAGPCRCKYVTWAQTAEAELAQVKAERDRLHALLWHIIDAAPMGVDQQLLDEAAKAVGYDEQGQ